MELGRAPADRRVERRDHLSGAALAVDPGVHGNLARAELLDQLVYDLPERIPRLGGDPFERLLDRLAEIDLGAIVSRLGAAELLRAYLHQAVEDDLELTPGAAEELPDVIGHTALARLEVELALPLDLERLRQAPARH